MAPYIPNAMKKLIFAFAIFATALPTFARADNVLERIATEILADRFGIGVQDILGTRRETREDVWDLGPVYSMSRYSNRDANDVQRMRASGMGWGQIAKQIGMHPGTFNKLRNQGYFDREPFWDDVMRRRYNVSQQDITSVRRRGAKLEDILGSVIVARGSGKSPSEVYNRYRSTKNWDKTANHYKFDLDNWKKVGKKVGWEGATVPPGKSQGKGQGKGTATGKGNSQGKGNGSSKGKGSGNSKGKGGKG